MKKLTHKFFPFLPYPIQVKTLAPEMPAMFFSCGEDKALCMAVVPKDVVNGKGFKASDWCKEVQALIDGKVSLVIKKFELSLKLMLNSLKTRSWLYLILLRDEGSLCWVLKLTLTSVT